MRNAAVAALMGGVVLGASLVGAPALSPALAQAAPETSGAAAADPGGGAPAARSVTADPQSGYGVQASAPSPAAEPQQTGAIPVTTQALTVVQLADMDLYNGRDEKLGDVDEVWVGPDNRSYLVVSSGGFFGVGERTFMVPLAAVALHGNRLIVAGLSDDEVKALPAWEIKSGYRELDDFETLPVRLAP